MTILKKLVIKGIRSYNPNKEQTIDFQTPLTLIIGQNGTGKTTLIECLKYITTGTLPPNSKGGIKQKKTEQKILEFNVWVNKNLKEVIDFNNTVKSTLGKLNKDDLTSIFEINSSILENVIFCHQDDSMWYLSEPATIKKKFDDIFSSTRYSKSLDNLKKSKKEVSTKIKVINTELSYLIKMKDKKNEIETKLKETKKDLEEKNKNIKNMEKNTKECEEILSNLNTEHNKIIKIYNKKKEIENFKNFKEIKYSELECKELRNNLNIEEYKNKIENLQTEIENENKKIKEIEKNKEKYEKIKNFKIEKKEIKNKIEIYFKNMKNLEKWLEEQKNKFLTKLKIKEEIIKNQNFIKIFDFFFGKYEEELKKKNEVLNDLKKESDKMKWEYENNKIKLENAHIDNIDDAHIYDNINDIENIIDIDDKIKRLEKEYDESIKMTRELILNEEKIKKRDELLLKLKNKTKTQEIENIKSNTEEIKKYKQEFKKYSEIINKLNTNTTIIKNQMSKFDNKNHKEFMIYISKESTDKISEMSLKTRRCFLCDKKLEDCDKYTKKLQGYSESEQNVKIRNYIVEIIKSYNDSINEEEFKIREINNKEDIYAKKLYKENNLHKNENIKENENFIDFIDDILQNMKNIKNKLEEEMGEKEMIILDLEEENLLMKNNIKYFIELENLDIKSISCKNTEEIKNEINKFKILKQRKEKKEKFLEIKRLKKENGILEEKLKKIKEEIKIKTEKTENLRISIFNKKSEINYKIQEYEMKKEAIKEEINKLNIINNDLKIVDNNGIINYKNEIDSNIILDLKSNIDDILKEEDNIEEINFEDDEKLKERNLKNKNLLYSLKNELSEKIDLLNLVNEHLEYFKNLEKYKNIEKEISFLEENLKNKKTFKKASDDVINDYLKILDTKMSSIKTRHTEILEKKNMTKGEINQLRILVDNYTRELNTEYKDVIKDYNKKYIENKILDLTSSDIDKCINVLDKSIIDYHYNKIEEINLNLKELWGNCYKGNDIDHIKLKINENGSKNYSYKMMIVKNNVELDMRNRSSAGQKMIGNILLRMSLSKVFCCNFNVLTLDEPTTNLDKENVESLAYTLVNITKTNPNLQLIIITHDEDFLSIMCRENIQYYYRLTRNQNSDSIIKKESA
ncbi:DNA repair protein RAD50 [Vairimorpha necatrix]|uniref:DNA repair protein RAD50 n=1 Tax=Vairimorpha necatrix TaxID=6039 RepID=A0AAX4JE63_9MICR